MLKLNEVKGASGDPLVSRWSWQSAHKAECQIRIVDSVGKVTNVTGGMFKVNVDGEEIFIDSKDVLDLIDVSDDKQTYSDLNL